MKKKNAVGHFGEESFEISLFQFGRECRAFSLHIHCSYFIYLFIIIIIIIIIIFLLQPSVLFVIVSVIVNANELISGSDLAVCMHVRVVH